MKQTMKQLSTSSNSLEDKLIAELTQLSFSKSKNPTIIGTISRRVKAISQINSLDLLTSKRSTFVNSSLKKKISTNLKRLTKNGKREY